MSFSIDELGRFIKGGWFEKTGIIIAIVFIVVSLFIPLLVFSNYKISEICCIVLISTIIVVFVWMFSRRLPRTPKGKVGFVICIACLDDKEELKVREDFIIPLKKCIKEGKTGKSFYIIEIPRYAAKNIIDNEDAQRIRIKCKAHFIIFGRVRLRELNGEECHYIDLEGIVIHKQIHQLNKFKLATEFSELLPRQVSLPTDNDLLTFNFTSEWADIVARYIIGIAAYLSGYFEYAESLYLDALHKLSTKDMEFPVYKKLHQRLPIRFSEIHETKASIAYNRWLVDHDSKWIDEIDNNINQINPAIYNSTRIQNLRSIYVFLKYKDANQAIKILKNIDEKDSSVLNYNIAFLYAYQGNLSAAVEYYQKGFKFSIDPLAIPQIEEFIEWILKEEPEKYQLLFCLGYFDYRVKGDKILAENNFKLFLKKCPENKYGKQRKLAVIWLRKIENNKN